MNHALLSDLLDDLTRAQLTDLLLWLSANSYIASRANIRDWRRMQKLPNG